MADIVDAATRSRMMSGIRGKNTKPELAIRKAIHRLGFRYRLHRKDVVGRPDMIFPAARAAVFVNGCFWHGHDCRFFRMPSSRQEFWSAKIAANRTRDANVRVRLENEGWRHLTIWECAIRGQGESAPTNIAAAAVSWLKSKKMRGEIRGD